MSQEAKQAEQTTDQPSGEIPSEIVRPLYVKKVPETVWNRVHENAIKSRMRLSTYLIKVMELGFRRESGLSGREIYAVFQRFNQFQEVVRIGRHGFNGFVQSGPPEHLDHMPQ